MSLFSKGEIPNANKMNQKTVFVGASEPASVFDGQLWYDTAADKLKQRRGSSWVDVGSDTESSTDVIPVSDGTKSIGMTTYRWKEARAMEIAFSRASKLRIYASSDASISNLTWTYVNLDAVSFDSLGEYSPGYEGFQALYDGYFFIYGQATFLYLPWNSTQLGGYTGEVAIERNGSTFVTRGTTTSSSDNSSRLHTAVCIGTVKLNAYDYLRMKVWHNYTSSRTLKGGSTNTFMTVVKLGT